MTLTISELRQAHPTWFARGNAKYHGDLSYRVLHDKQHRPYLVRYMWNDKYSKERIAHWKINPIGTNLEILGFKDIRDSLKSFATLADVKKALAEREV